jgi:hypothetical protein
MGSELQPVAGTFNSRIPVKYYRSRLTLLLLTTIASVEDKATMVRRMQAATVPGGLNAVSLGSTFTPVPEPHRGVEVHCDDEDGVVVALYDGWDYELLYFERDKLDEPPGTCPAPA